MEWWKVLIALIIMALGLDLMSRPLLLRSDLRVYPMSVANANTLVVVAHGTGGSYNSALAVTQHLNVIGADVLMFDEAGGRSLYRLNVRQMLAEVQGWLASHQYSTIIFWGMSKGGKELAAVGSELTVPQGTRKVLLLHETPYDAGDIKLAPPWAIKAATYLLHPGVIGNWLLSPVMRAMAGNPPDVTMMTLEQRHIALAAHERGASVPFSRFVDQLATAADVTVTPQQLAAFGRIGYVVDAQSAVVNGPQALEKFRAATHTPVRCFDGVGQHVGVEYAPNDYAALLVVDVLPWAKR